MTPLREWSFVRVMLIGAGWVVLGVALIVLWIFLQVAWTADIGSGGGGIGAVSVGINALLLAIPLAPPIVLFLAWLVVRSRRR
jgi:hypothetical protein